MYNYKPIGIYAAKALADEEKRSNSISGQGEKKVINVYFSIPTISDSENSTAGQLKQKKFFPEIHKANLGEEIFLVAITENLIGKKLKIEIRQAKENQITDKDKPIVFKNQDRIGSIIITVGKGTKDKDENGQDYFSKYANANRLENLAWKSFLLKPESDTELERWKKVIENSREKKLYLYFHAEVLDEPNTEIKFSNFDHSQGEQNFSNSEGTYFEIGNGSEIITLKQLEDIFGIYSKHRKIRQEIVNFLNTFGDSPIHLDTPLRKAHFFAQVGAETLGINPDWMVETDVHRYTVANCKAVFGDRAKKLEAKGLLKIYCNDNPQKRLLNFMYAAENGKGNGNGNEASGDGYKYRGRGLKQLTGRGNYEDASEILQEIFPREYIDLEKFPDKIKEPKYAVLSALAFWEKHTIWKTADTLKISSEENIKKIRRRVNGSTTGWKDAKIFFEKGLKVFKV
ncbi:hypothetical protein [uncultured Chryseobacterium sp.]|uniref:glycoside hydrolase family 19 protein n=1 Tax=uncultured Chryseobacterium sp. TaxID=259322 RepID=UPI0025DC9F22|nr:hypothetical protein [uncultured Chryseobacterium sp.]